MRIIIHLGYPRTSTTFLQKNIFPNHNQINFLGPNNYKKLADAKITTDDLELLALKNNQEDLDNKIIYHSDKNLIKYFDEKKINLISTENYTMFQYRHFDFRDLQYLEILIKQHYKNAKFDFLIVLRNQYDLIKSLYFHNYHKISKLIKVKKFDQVFNLFLSKKSNQVDSNLKNFFLNYDFNELNIKLESKFNNSNIKYLFYEDFNLHREVFINEFCNFFELDSDYTTNLFNKYISERTNARKTILNKNYYIKTTNYKFIKSKTYFVLKKIIPFKSLFKKFFINNFVYSKFDLDFNKEEVLKQKFKEFYKNSNAKFFEQIKIKNKFKY